MKFMERASIIDETFKFSNHQWYEDLFEVKIAKGGL